MNLTTFYLCPLLFRSCLPFYFVFYVSYWFCIITYDLITRLKKQELASFSRSAEDVMRDVIESAKKELNSSEKSDGPEAQVEKPAKPNVDRPKILISVQDKDGHKQFRMYKVMALIY